MLFKPQRKPSTPKVLALAVLMSASASPLLAQDRVAIPGLNAPVTTVNEPEVEVPKPTAPAAVSSMPSRVVQVSKDDGHNVRPEDLPAVPAAYVAPAPRRPSAPVETRQDVVVSNGANVLIPISRGQINRIVTPFEDPQIQTVSEAELEVANNVVYVTPTDDMPVTMFITPQDDEGVAISLTLLPQSIPPIQANLLFTQAVPGSATGANGEAVNALGGVGYRGQAKRWERSQPFMDTLREMMRDLAMGNLPRGYTFADMPTGTRIPSCNQAGVNYDFSNAQFILGHDFRIFIAVAENQSSQNMEVSHAACTHPNRAAVAVWPHEILEPGQKTEVFLVTRIPQMKANTSTRPSLLN